MRAFTPAGAMTLTTEQSGALVAAITAATSLAELRHVARREYGLEAGGSFLELLIDFRQEKLDARLPGLTPD